MRDRHCLWLGRAISHNISMSSDAHPGAWPRQKVGDLLGEKALEEMLRLSSRDPRIIVR